MRIAMGDDEKRELTKLREAASLCADRRGMPLVCDCFSSGTAFLRAAEQARYDAVLLDIYMGAPNGIATAQMLRRKNDRSTVVFLTSSREYMQEAFGVHAFDYLVKPVDAEKMEALLLELSEAIRPEDRLLRLPIGRETVGLPYGQIAAVVSDSNYCMIETDRELRVRMTFRELAGCLQGDERFLIINRGVMVNMDQVLSMENTDCRMCGGRVYPLNFRKRAELRDRLTAYQFNQRARMVSEGG